MMVKGLYPLYEIRLRRLLGTDVTLPEGTQPACRVVLLNIEVESCGLKRSLTALRSLPFGKDNKKRMIAQIQLLSNRRYGRRQQLRVRPERVPGAATP